jgi:hypothetical protein
VKRKKEIACTDLELLLKLRASAMELMESTPKTAEFQDGMIKTQFAEADQVKKKKETACIDQELWRKTSTQE